MENTNMENTSFYGFNQIFNNPLLNVNLNYGFDTSNRTIERLFFVQMKKLSINIGK
ncbi:hypothetical protein HY636_02545 [Candidatus Woesearchaeota archaeon]|nr:hypothetical protein [Candidatus Woesearchaeota archaeon]